MEDILSLKNTERAKKAEELGAKLRERRQSEGISLKELAEELYDRWYMEHISSAEKYIIELEKGSKIAMMKKPYLEVHRQRVSDVLSYLGYKTPEKRIYFRDIEDMLGTEFPYTPSDVLPGKIRA